MTIGVAHVDSGWILSTIAKKMCEADDRFTAFPIADIGDHIQEHESFYYVDVQNCWSGQFRNARPDAKHIGMFTHLDRDSDETFRQGWDMLDGVVHMCNRYEHAFRKWYAESQMAVIVPGEVSSFGRSHTHVGIVQRGGHTGKGFEFLPDVIKALPVSVRESIKLHFCGQGWIETAERDYHGVSSENYIESDWRLMYDRCDYILIPSLWEGGPMALLEALATGTRIIAADVGFVRDFYDRWGYDTDHFSVFVPGDVHGCAQRICEVVAPRVRMRSLVTHLSYADYANRVHDFIGEIRINAS